MKILYFAWMREHTGCSSEDIKLPAEIRTIGDLASYLRGRSAGPVSYTHLTLPTKA